MKKYFKEYLNSTPTSKKHKVNVAKIVSKMRDGMRRETKKYKQPLKNGFYRGLSPADIKMLKSKGATSGCATILPMHLMDKVKKFAKKTLKRR